MWNLQSLLRRIDLRMQQLVQGLGGSLPSVHKRPSTSRLRISPSALPESPFDDASSSTSSTSGSDDTDASSVHTPRDSYAEYPVMYRPSNSDDALINAERGIVAAPQLVPSRSQEDTHMNRQCPAPQPQQEGPLAEYTSLHASTLCLRALIHRTESTEQAFAADRCAHLAILEVKSKRRAWSSRDLLGNAQMAHAGLGCPLRSSPLAYCKVITPDTALEARKKYPGISRLPPGILERRLELSNTNSHQDGEPVNLLSPTSPTPPTISQSIIPFPQTEDGDDFCSTGPQDLSLFGGPAEFESEDSEFIESPTSYAYSCSSDDLPSLFTSVQSDPSMVPYQPFNPPTRENCQEFTLGLDNKQQSLRSQGQLQSGIGRGRGRVAQGDWLVDPSYR